MQKRLLVGLVLFASTLVQFPGIAVILPPPVKTVTLTWEYPETNSEIVFNIYGTANLGLPLSEWPLIATVAETSCSLPMKHESFFFVVSASNVVTGMESSFSGSESPPE